MCFVCLWPARTLDGFDISVESYIQLYLEFCCSVLGGLYLSSEYLNRIVSQRVKAIFPDAGVAAFVKYQWKDVRYSFGRFVFHLLDML